MEFPFIHFAVFLLLKENTISNQRTLTSIPNPDLGIQLNPVHPNHHFDFLVAMW